MRLHNDDVTVGDAVYDLIRGIGEVSRIDNTKSIIYITYNQSGDAEFAYNADGISETMAAQKPTLFWHNPVMFVPPKDMDGWQKLTETIVFINDTFFQ